MSVMTRSDDLRKVSRRSTDCTSLDVGCLGHIFSFLDPECRVGVVALVAKFWNLAERCAVSRSEALEWTKDMPPGLANFQLTRPCGASKLEKVDLSLSSEDSSLKLLLLDGLASQAPRLRSLAITAISLPTGVNFLARLDRVTQLEELGLTGWHYSTAQELVEIAHLTKLRSLKAVHLRKVMGSVTVEVACKQLRATLQGLPALTRLKLQWVDASNIFDSTQGPWTKLRSLQCNGKRLLDVAGLEDMTGLTSLDLGPMYESSRIEDTIVPLRLQNLSHLQELTQTVTPGQPTPAISGAAVLTALCLCGEDFGIYDQNSWNVVVNQPFSLLQGLKRLQIRRGPINNDFPMFWTLLTGLTSLHLPTLGPTAMPTVMSQMLQLRHLELQPPDDLVFDGTLDSPPQLLAWMSGVASSLTQLTSLHVRRWSCYSEIHEGVFQGLEVQQFRPELIIKSVLLPMLLPL